MSRSFRPGSVSRPSALDLIEALATNSTSRSVAVTESLPCSADSRRFARIGIVCRRSTTPMTDCRAASRLSRSALNFIGAPQANGRSSDPTGIISYDCSSYRAAYFQWKSAEKRQGRTTCAKHNPVSQPPRSYATPVESLWSEKPRRTPHILSTSVGQDSQQVEVILARRGAPISRRSLMRSQACITVVWSRPPKASPISGRL